MVELIRRRWTRREWLAAVGAGLLTRGAPAGARGTTASSAPPAAHHAMASAAPAAIAPSRADRIVVPEGYRVDLIARWGDALLPGAKSLGTEDWLRGALLRADAAAAQARQFGSNFDGLGYFPLRGASSTEGLLCINHEYTTLELSFPGIPADDRARARMRRDWVRAHPQAVAWMQAAHGVSVTRVARGPRGWRIVRDARFARRITA
ncbi:MAG: DUF839 domain-containing protein, partial [Gammaproteobacteria bacterium]|nr:DUF839 domain-containing protein [Gammaproteobacteria bacterium]